MPVLNRWGERLNWPDEPLAEWAFRMLCLLEHDWRSAERNVYKPLELDHASRKRHKKLIGEGGRPVAQRRHVNKCLSLELCAAGATDKLDRPAEVTVYCSLNSEGRPQNFAPGGYPDAVADYGSFLAVIEVSAKKFPSDDDYRCQLEAGLRHAQWAAEKFGAAGKPCFCLIVNERSFGDPETKQVFKDFAQGLDPPQPDFPKLVPFSVDEFADLAHWAGERPDKPIQADGIAAALSEIAALCLADKPPTDKGWMLETAKARLSEATPQLKPRRRKRERDGGWTPR